MTKRLRQFGILLVACASLAVGMLVIRPEVAPNLSTAALIAILGLAFLPIAAIAALAIEREAA